MRFCQSNNINFFTSFGKDILESSHELNPLKGDLVELNVYDRLDNVQAATKRSVVKKIIKEHSLPLNRIKKFSFHDDRFRRDYKKITQAIAAKSLDKGVAFNTLKIEFEKTLSIDHFLNFSQASIERNHAYGIWSKDQGIIGLSPELLLSKIDDKYIIDALAGTSDHESGLDSAKLINEHQTVVDSITEKLDQQNIQYEVGEKYKIKFRHYFHWYQQIKISATNNAVSIIDSIAPTAAISGYPSNDFKRLSSTLEFEKNSHFHDYAGCFHFKHHYFEKNIIGIRNIQWEGSTAYIHARCGINCDSVLGEELAESHMKMKTTLRYFGYELNPVVICTTSGSAAIETLSALAEAYFSGVKLILITCDRPFSLSQSHAPEMIDQAEIVKIYARHFMDIESQNDFELNSDPGIPVENNLYPLVINYRVNKNEQKECSVVYESNPLHDIKKMKLNLEKTLFIFNDHQGISKTHYQELESPFYNAGREFNEYSREIFHDEKLQSKLSNGEFEHVIRIGRCPNSKAWRILHTYGVDLWHIDPFEKPCHSFGTVLVNNNIHRNIDFLICELKKSLITDAAHSSVNSAGSRITKADIDVENMIDKYPGSEISFFKRIFSINSFKSFYIGNSMPIRYTKFFKTSASIIANRGVNGIDGIISSAIGYARFKKEPVALIIGDLSTLYDISSLVHKIPENLYIFIINNYGGQIFEQIKLKSVKNDHTLSFEKISQGFPNRVKALSIDSFSNEEKLNTLLKDKNVFECLVDNDQSKKFWRDYRESF